MIIKAQILWEIFTTKTLYKTQKKLKKFKQKINRLFVSFHRFLKHLFFNQTIILKIILKET